MVDYRSTNVAVRTGTLTNFTSVGNAFADVGTIVAAPFKTKRISLTGTVNDMEATILGSLDGGVTYSVTVEATYDIAVGATVVKTVSDLYTHLKVQGRPNVGGAHGTLATKYVMSIY